MSPKQLISHDMEDNNTAFFKNALGLNIFCRYWYPKSEPRALVFVSHGFTEHSLNYEKLAIPLQENGYLVFAHDHLGHGRSEGTRVHVDKVADYVADVYQHVDLMKEKYPNLPVFYVGHSMGGLIGILAAEETPGYFAGFVLIGPAVVPNSQMASPIIPSDGYFAWLLHAALSHLRKDKERHSLMAFLSQLTISRLLGKYFPSFPVKKIDLSEVCFNEEAVKELKKDRLRYQGYAKAGWGYAMIEAVQKAHSSLEKMKDPFIVLQGEDDKICHVQGARDLFDHSTSADKQIKIYTNANHALLYEWKNIDQQVITETVNWINQRV